MDMQRFGLDLADRVRFSLFAYSTANDAKQDHHDRDERDPEEQKNQYICVSRACITCMHMYMHTLVIAQFAAEGAPGRARMGRAAVFIKGTF